MAIKEITLTATVVRNFQKGEVTITLSDPSNEDIKNYKDKIVIVASQILDKVEEKNPNPQPEKTTQKQTYYKRRDY